jgi:preprotein translocase subunit YajC
MPSLIVLADGAAPAPVLLRFLAADAPAAPVTSAAGTSLPASAAVASTALPTDVPPPSNPLGEWIMPLLFLGVFFLIFAPQMSRNKKHQKLLTELKSGDDVITTGGLYGTIVQVKPGRFVIEIAKGVRVEITRANVEARAPDEIPDPPTPAK